MIGTCVSHYRILERLGAGGMGEVYTAEDLHLARRVAIKFPTMREDGAGPLTRFLNEARAASRLEHPNIARIYDYGEAPDGRPFLVMELIAGTNLRDLLKDGPLAPARAIAIVEGVLRALREAHAHGLIHRDIKPSNIMLTAAGEVKVLDFGLAKEILAAPAGDASAIETAPMGVTRAGVNPGSPAYMSPEQARGGLLDGRSDLFSAGLVLYESLTGQRAFSGTTGGAVLAQVADFDPPPPSAGVPGISAALDRITQKALAKNPAARYQTADEMLRDLAEAPAAARRFAAGRLAAFAALALAILAVVGGLVWRARRHEPSPEAMRWYQLGAAALRDGTYYRAAKALDQAVAAQPDFALAHARLAEAWNELDDSGKAKSEMLLARGPSAQAPSGSGALYVDAILRTLTGDFAGAIKSYTSLLDGVPEAEKAAVLVDLGRARERNGEIAKALDAYREAARRDPQSAAAHLREGILLGRQRSPDAGAEFARAESLYQALSNNEGQAEVLFQRGLWASTDARRLPEARASLEKAIEVSRAIATEYQEIAATLQLSAVTYQEGDAAKAEAIAASAVERARGAGMAYLAARGLIDLGTSRMLKGDYSRAEVDLREALDLARRFQMRRNEARSLSSLGSLHQVQGRAEAVLDEVQPALAYYRQMGFRREALQCITLIARAKRDLGKEGEALTAFQEQLSLAQNLDDRQQMAQAEQGIASVLLLQERLPEALVHYQACYERFAALKSTDGIVRALGGRAHVLSRLGRYAEAETLLAEAEARTASIANPGPLAPLVAERRASLALARGLLQEAAAKARQASETTSAAPYIRADAKCTAGLALARNGFVSAGKRLCEECVSEFGAQSDRQALAEARLTLAEALLGAGDPGGASAQIRMALEVIDPAGHKEAGWRGYALLAQSLRRSGDATHAREAAATAASKLAELRSVWNSADFEAYSGRSDILALMKELKK